jgi:hypothetical protein
MNLKNCTTEKLFSRLLNNKTNKKERSYIGELFKRYDTPSVFHPKNQKKAYRKPILYTFSNFSTFPSQNLHLPSIFIFHNSPRFQNGQTIVNRFPNLGAAFKFMDADDE